METHFELMQQARADVTREKLAADLKAVMRDAEELMNLTASLADDKISGVRTRLAAALTSAKATCHWWEDSTVQAAKATDRVLREHPYESVGLAFGLGLLMGVLLGRR
ncbi:MAG: DUF883 family protein [Chloroflexi bacterium]|nr:DUF883 family protein [Chloroflexota bacterium]